MEKNEILSKLNEIFIDVMDLDENFVLTENMNSDDIEEWDSLTNIQIVVAIEKALGVKMTSAEIRSWANIGEMMDALLIKLKQGKA